MDLLDCDLAAFSATFPSLCSAINSESEQKNKENYSKSVPKDSQYNSKGKLEHA
jgi:hypothetical protein